MNATVGLKRGNNREAMESKQLRDSMSRFGGALEGLKTNAMKQTTVLTEMLQMQVDERVRKEREDALKRVQEDEEKRNSNPFESTGKRSHGREHWSFNPMTIVGGARAVVGALTSAAFILAPIVAETVENLLKVGLEHIGVSPAFAKSFSENVGTSIQWGALGLIFGRKVGMLFAAGSFLWTELDKQLDLEGKISGLARTIGIEVSPTFTDAIGIAGTTLLTAIGFRLVRKAMGHALSAVFTEGLAKSVGSSVVRPLSWVAKSVLRTGFGAMMRVLPLGAAAAIAGMYVQYGDQAAEWLSEQTGLPVAWSDAVVTTASFTAAGATLGAQFGIHGAIIGAVVGLVAGLGYSVWKWFSKRQEEAQKRAAEVQAETDAQIKALDSNFDITTGENTTLGDNAAARSVVTGENLYSAAKDQGKEHGALAIATQLFDTSNASVESLRAGAASLKSSIKTTMDSFDISDPEGGEKLLSAIQSIQALNQSVNEDISNLKPGDVNKDALLSLRQIIKSDGNRLIRFADQNGMGQRLKEIFDGAARFQSGTRGFMNFGVETPALLHGREAVVPENTDAADMLKKFFKEDWSFKDRVAGLPAVDQGASRLRFMAQSDRGQGQNVVIAPTTNAPVVTIHKGNRVSQSTITSIGSSNDLDYGLPRGVL